MTSPRIARLRQDMSVVGPAAAEAFWQEMCATGTPLIEPPDTSPSQGGDGSRLVTFVWRGEAQSTAVHWGAQVDLERLPESDIWVGTTALPANLRTLYYFGHDGAASVPMQYGEGPTHLDAANPTPFVFPRDPDDPTDHDSWASLLELPAAPAEPWLAPVPPAAQGNTLDAELTSVALGGQRRVSVHLPAALPTDGLPVLVAFDGYNTRTVLNLPTTVDNLIPAGRIPPLVTLMVHSPNETRNVELNPRPPIADFVADELLPWARRRWRVTDDPTNNVISGVSRGGLAAAYVALVRPDAVGAVVAQSGSFWWPAPDEGEPEWLTGEFATRPAVRLRFYLEVGDREVGPGPGGAPAQVDVNRRMRDTLLAKGYPLVYAEYTGAHDYVNWRRTIADGLIAVLGANHAAGEATSTTPALA